MQVGARNRYGKSLIYTGLPNVYDLIQENTGSIVVVVCPLIALMKDQVTSLGNLGLSAACCLHVISITYCLCILVKL